MKRKPKEKLSERLLKLFLTHVKEYDLRYFYQGHEATIPPINEWTPLHFAEEMKRHSMEMIREYEPEDIE